MYIHTFIYFTLQYVNDIIFKKVHIKIYKYRTINTIINNTDGRK